MKAGQPSESDGQGLRVQSSLKARRDRGDRIGCIRTRQFRSVGIARTHARASASDRVRASQGHADHDQGLRSRARPRGPARSEPQPGLRVCSAGSRRPDRPKPQPRAPCPQRRSARAASFGTTTRDWWSAPRCGRAKSSGTTARRSLARGACASRARSARAGSRATDQGLRVATSLKAGKIMRNHSAGLFVRSSVRAGRIVRNHNNDLRVRSADPSLEDSCSNHSLDSVSGRPSRRARSRGTTARPLCASAARSARARSSGTTARSSSRTSAELRTFCIAPPGSIVRGRRRLPGGVLWMRGASDESSEVRDRSATSAALGGVSGHTNPRRRAHLP